LQIEIESLIGVFDSMLGAYGDSRLTFRAVVPVSRFGKSKHGWSHKSKGLL